MKAISASAAAPARTTISMDQPCWRLARALQGADAGKGTHDVENAPDFLTRARTWYLDRSRPGRHTLLHRPRAGQDTARTEAIAPTLITTTAGPAAPTATNWA
ncbi:hypothetical protein [Streptomyces sp. NPDC086777]|uniref:hypothetical protein n=1 Tax=Streptomyces sp. NPDC086777 TaxID=3154866 RepID=UPI003450EECB